MPMTRVLVPVALLVAALVGCAQAASATPVPRDPDAVTIANETGIELDIAYEYPDGTSEPVVAVGPGETAVVTSLFDGREGLCRVGRLVASDPAGAEVDELYNVCRSRLWTVEAR